MNFYDQFKIIKFLSCSGPQHGYAIADGCNLSRSTIHLNLFHIEENGLIYSWKEPPKLFLPGRRIYNLTEKGTSIDLVNPQSILPAFS